MKFYVYRHIRLDTGVPFYVGKGLKNRAFDLIKRNKYHLNIQAKTEVKIEIVKEFYTELEAFIFEKSLIKLYKSLGYCKANLQDGGRGGSKGRIISAETREKLSKAALGSKRTLETRKKMGSWQRGRGNNMYGKSPSQETRKKLKEAAQNRIWSNESKRKISLNTSMSKTVHCNHSKREWNSCADAARDLNLNYNTLRARLNGSLLNNTTLIYKENL